MYLSLLIGTPYFLKNIPKDSFLFVHTLPVFPDRSIQGITILSPVTHMSDWDWFWNIKRRVYHSNQKKN
jgi:hypothetical protein